MQVILICVGKLKEKFWKLAVEEYIKRLSGYAKVSIVEVADEPMPDSLSVAQQSAIMQIEGERVLKHIKERDGVIALDIAGTELSSPAWSKKFVEFEQEGFGRIVFIVGGSCGLSESVLNRANFRWSFGPITLPHQLARVVLLEQIYRAIRIARNEPYHK